MKYCVGVDFGGTNIAVGLVDIDGKRIIGKKSTPTNAPRPCTEISKDIARLCEELCLDEGIKMQDLSWIGIATPGVVKDSIVIGAVNLGWKNEAFGKILNEITGIPTFVANDANAAAFAEAVWGVGEGESSLVAITLGTGVGGGIVLDGKIIEGINGFAAELGHIVIDAGGRSCGCGKRGCFESYCSASAIIKEAKRMMRLCPDSKMWELCAGEPDNMNGKIPFDAYRMGDYAATVVVKDFADYLAIGICNMINILQPAVVCIGGGISYEGDALLELLNESVKANSFGTDDLRTKVKIAKFKNDAGIIGAALLGIQEEK